MSLRSAAWWPFFIVTALWAQRLVPGVDFLVLGLILSLQEDRPSQTLWLALVFLLIQEGTGSLAFGAGLLWYGAVVALFSLGRWLFEVENMFFIVILGAMLGLWRFGLAQMLATLQEYDLNYIRLAQENILQAVIIPPGWFLARTLRERFGRAQA